MPRPNPPRTIGSEARVAERVAVLRQRADPPFTFDGLADAMAARGVPIQPTALFKIEKGDRKITVDELVAFAEVFGVSIESLVRRPADVKAQRAEEVLDELQEAHRKSAALRRQVNSARKKIASLEHDLSHALEGERQLRLKLGGLLNSVTDEVAAAIRAQMPVAPEAAGEET